MNTDKQTQQNLFINNMYSEPKFETEPLKYVQLPSSLVYFTGRRIRNKCNTASHASLEDFKQKNDVSSNIYIHMYIGDQNCSTLKLDLHAMQTSVYERMHM